jgi:hypothetical protein
MNIRSAYVRILSVCFVALVLALPWRADASRSLYSFARVQQGSTSICQQGGQDFTTADAHCVVSALSGFNDTLGDAESRSLYGSLRVYTRLATTDADGRNYDAHANSTFTDNFTITAPGHALGSAGSGRIEFTVDAVHTIYERDLTSGSVSAKTDFYMGFNGTRRGNQGTDLNPYFFIAFKYGVPFDITVELHTKVNCSSCIGRYDVETDALNTATLDLVLVNGLTVDEYLVESESGHSYANVVPEPSPFAGQLSAVATLGVLVANARGRRPKSSSVKKPTATAMGGSGAQLSV